MQRKRAEASGGVVMLDPARLKPGRKVSGTSKFRMPRIEDEDENLKVQGPARARATRDWWRVPAREWAERLGALGCLMWFAKVNWSIAALGSSRRQD